MQMREDRNEPHSEDDDEEYHHHHGSDLTNQASNLVVSVRIKGGGRLVQDQKFASSAQHE